MLKNFKIQFQKFIYKYLLPFLVTRVGLGFMKLVFWTCKIKIHGLEEFKKNAQINKPILILWHNDLALAPLILSRYASEFIYAAFVSKSRDGELISAVVESFSIGRTIRVPHNNRHQALKEVIRRLEDNKEIIVITPDGPRGPRHEVKPGVAMAALQTSAFVVPLKWSANRFWSLKTWDKLKIPKPFSTIHVTFESPVQFQKELTSIEEAQLALQKALK